MTQTKQNAPYGYYELGLRADMLEVELKAACAACTHLHEKLEAAEAAASKWRADAERLLQAKDAAERKAESWERGHDYAWAEKVKAEAECVRANDSARARDERAARHIDELEAQLAETRERLEAHRQNLAAANEWGARADAKLQAVEALLRKPGCWSEWARECLAVLGGGK